MSSTVCEWAWRGRPVSIEYQWVGAAADAGQDAPVWVFLHEGLGSVAMWRDFPSRLCAALGVRGLVYSRPGYGASTPRAWDEVWGPDFMHQQALEVLPALLTSLGVDVQAHPPYLFGHSDGGSIALIHAAHRPEAVSGIVVLAPHIMVEDVSIRSIAAAKQAYLTTDLKHKLARYHHDPDSAFWGWNGVWLSPAFRSWQLNHEIHHLRCPVLAIQGLDDEYGTLAQIRDIAQAAPQTQLLELPQCGHSPHKDQAEAVMAAVQAWRC
ncbi:MAG: alpha/beta hydrolase [Pseudomonadota bacterium]